MRLIRSFRARLLLGSVIGSLGLLAIAHLFSVFVVHRYRVAIDGGHAAIVVLVALLFVVFAVTQVQKSLSPFASLRERLLAARDGLIPRIDGTYPSEVQPLVNDLNSLLEHREQVVRRAIAKAGDLAHGLKTPLAVLSHEAERAEAAGHTDLADAISREVEKMRRQVDYHLAHARAAASGATPGTRCAVLASAEGLARTLLRLHAGRGLVIDVRVAPEHAVRVERQELDEMLGNLLDNAFKWAKTRVVVESAESAASADAPGSVVITVDDDGPGLEPGLREAVLQRGVRADEAAPGSGFGLAIVRDLAELYGGRIALEDSPYGGLRARLELPV